MKKIAILTPTFNREKTLPSLYHSLLKQTSKNFIWLVIDDGSIDDTEILMTRFIKENKIKIEYFKQKNLGKHIAINNGVSKINEEITFIVDSDDRLTYDAIEQINKYWEIVDKEKCSGIVFLRDMDDKRTKGKKFPNDLFISKYNDIVIRKSIPLEKAEVVATSELKKYPFPQFKGEKYMGEGVLWHQIGSLTKTLFVNKVIYIGNYMDDGLTSSGWNLRIKNPLGAMLNEKLLLNKDYPIFYRFKHSLVYIAYGIFSGKTIKSIIKESGYPRLIRTAVPLGYCVYIVLKLKYGNIKNR